MTRRRLSAALVTLATLVTGSCAREVARTGPAPTSRAQAASSDRWHWRAQDGTCMEIPEWEIHEIDRDLYVLRQSPCASYEKPFVFLVFGDERALLLDTGAGKDNHLAASVVHLMRQWLARTGRRSISLVVAHTHEHGDHTAGDADFAALQVPELPVTVTALDLEATKRLFGIASWPTDIGHIDLGGRILDAIPIPGHSKLSVAVYDRRTSNLFTGDTLYPGRLYVFDMAAFETSVDRLVRFTADNQVAHVIGNHIEQTMTPARDYPIGTIFQPDEHALVLPRSSLQELQAALAAMHGAPRRLALRDFTIWPAGPGVTTPEEIERAMRLIEDQERAKWSPPARSSSVCGGSAP